MNTKITLNTIEEDEPRISFNLRRVLVRLPHIDSNKEAVLSVLDGDIPFTSSDYDDIIPKGKNVYLTNAYLPEESIRIPKEDYKRILDLPHIDVFEDNADDVELDKEHYEIAKRIENFSLNIDSEDLLMFTDVKDRVKKIISLIDDYEKKIKTNNLDIKDDEVLTLGRIGEADYSTYSNLINIIQKTFHCDKEEILSAITKEESYQYLSYFEIILSQNFIYLIDLYFPRNITKISKKDGIKFLTLPKIDIYKDSNKNMSIMVEREHYEIAKRIKEISLNIDSDEYFFTEEEQIENIIALIKEHENRGTVKIP